MKSPIIPFLRYRDIKAAHDWLINAFGLESYDTTMVDGQMVHAEVSWRGMGTIQLGGASEGSVKMMSPLDLPALNQGVYIYVGEPADVDKHYEQAVAAGAEIIYEPRDAFYGARDYGVKDLEGHYWAFGSYKAQ